MKTRAGALVAGLALAGCATSPPTERAAARQPAFTGEVWTWDEQASTVTLRQNTRTFAVKVTPDQLAGLRLHQIATVRGELALADIEQGVVPPGWLTPRAEADRTETTGTVAAVDPSGTVSVRTPEGELRFWIAQPGRLPFQPGENVRAWIRVQALDVVPAPPREEPASDEPAASPTTEPGEYALFRGRVTAADPAGRLTVESSRGPVTVAVPAVGRYRVGDWVEVSTTVRPGR